MTLETWIAAVIVASLVVYALSGGADFGGGVWDLLATGPRARAQRELIAKAIGPIWEANHVWLVLVVVLLFVCFPLAFAALSVALHIPLLLMLIGIVLRGSAFAFRSYGGGPGSETATWSRVFAIASVVTPIMLGVCIGAVAAGRIRVAPDGRAVPEFLATWLAPFPFVVGLLALTMFAMLAAIYLILETSEKSLREDFRRRAIAASMAAGALASLGLALAPRHAPIVGTALWNREWAPALRWAAGAVGVGAIGSLVARRYGWARVLAMAEVALVILGWALAQLPYAIPPDLTLARAGAPARVLRGTLLALAAGSVLLLPSFAYLYLLFKRRPS